MNVFKLLLNTALENNTPAEELPSKIFIVSDMQFDKGCIYNQSALENIKQKYLNYHYPVPELVFWNVAARNNQPALMDESGIQLVSGFSPSLFEYISSSCNLSPYEQMLKVLNSDRYNQISI